MEIETTILLYGFATGVIVTLLTQHLIRQIKYIGVLRKLIKEQQIQVRKYAEELKVLPKDDQERISDKALNTLELVNDAEREPASFFEHQGMTKQQYIEQLYKQYDNWLKQNNYPRYKKD